MWVYFMRINLRKISDGLVYESVMSRMHALVVKKLKSPMGSSDPSGCSFCGHQ